MLAPPSLVGERVLAIGVDVVDVRRFREMEPSVREGVLARLFTANERAECATRADPWPHLAARFAAKEAAVKALASVGITAMPGTEFEVTTDANGAPRLVHASKTPRGASWRVSLAHEAEMAIAFCALCG